MEELIEIRVVVSADGIKLLDRIIEIDANYINSAIDEISDKLCVIEENYF